MKSRLINFSVQKMYLIITLIIPNNLITDTINVVSNDADNYCVSRKIDSDSIADEHKFSSDFPYISEPKATFFDTIIIPHDYYELNFSTPPSNWHTTYGDWPVSQAPFGNNIGNGHPPEFNYNTYWPVYSTLYLRKQVDLSMYDLSSLNWFLGVDNGYYLFVNGTQISQHWAHGYTYRWEYSGTINPALLNHGLNIISIICVDDGGLTAFDMMLTANKLPGGQLITNILINQRNDGSGMVDVYFNLYGTGSQYNIAFEASFDGGNTYTTIPASFLSGDVSNISPGTNKHIVWDGLGSHPNTYSTSTKLKIMANE